MRQTSIETYQQIEEGGLLSEMRWTVYRTLFHHGPLTGRELNQRLGEGATTSASYHKRLSELELLGVAYVTRERVCTITGRNACEWDVTDKLPSGEVTHVQRPSNDVIRRAVEDLRIIERSGVKFSEDIAAVGKWLVYASRDR